MTNDEAAAYYNETMPLRRRSEPAGVPLPVPPELIEQMRQRASEFRIKLAGLLNSYSCENGSDTPDWILANYITACLAAFDTGVVAREKWNGRHAGGRSIPPQSPFWTDR